MVSSTSTNGVSKGCATKKLNSELRKPHKVLGVEFAPINIPLERRKQTLAVLTWTALFFFSGPGGPVILVYTFFFTRLWPLSLLYAIWIVYDRNTCNVGSRKNGTITKFFKNWVLWKYYVRYFPIKLVKTAELDPKRNYLLASHPHGILASGTFASFSTEANKVSTVFPNIQFNMLTLPLNFYLPIYRELCLGHGLCSAKKESMNYLLSHPDGGRGAVLVPGGAQESLESHPGKYVVQLKKRKGFVKVALQNGSPLVPIYCFGENDIYDQVNNPDGSLLRGFQNKVMELFTFAPLFFTGRGIFQYNYGILPRRHPIFVVVGAPIDVEKVESPTNDQIDSLHSKYMQALQNLFDKHKSEFAHSDAQLKII
ncbi:diacylglycerol O-acyltransferase 2 [Folsomia candida]|uniref:diacylglycerol O-acyltransferase 2 n=1 Tax=Folsomia candida TaxID=158441 RepID=UPI000B8FB7ED|nr:diacylglycerol O-acyltransferase 2 [Folsomia candida]